MATCRPPRHFDAPGMAVWAVRNPRIENLMENPADLDVRPFQVAIRRDLPALVVQEHGGLELRSAKWPVRGKCEELPALSFWSDLVPQGVGVRHTLRIELELRFEG